MGSLKNSPKNQKTSNSLLVFFVRFKKRRVKLPLKFCGCWLIQSDSIYFSNWRCKKRAICESWFFSCTWKVIYIHDKIFWAVISRIQITVVIERIVWHINGKVIATTSYRNRSESFLKSAYHGLGNFCNLLAIIKRLNLFDFKVICLMLVCKGFIVRGFHWQHVVLYHVKMDKLLQKEAKVTKVPNDTYGERERERERETERDGEKNFNSGHKMQSLPIRSWWP